MSSHAEVMAGLARFRVCGSAARKTHWNWPSCSIEPGGAWSMEHGQWSRLWRSQQLPFSKRKAEMLVIIGRGLGGTNAQTLARLPSGWNTLYYIAQFGQKSAERMITEGRIHPRLQLRQARELLAEFKPALAKKTPQRRNWNDGWTDSPSLFDHTSPIGRSRIVSFSVLNSNAFSKLCHRSQIN